MQLTGHRSRKTGTQNLVKATLCAASLLVMLDCAVHAQYVAEYDRQPFGSSARAVALAYAYVGETHDPSVMYNNPAALAFLQHTSFVIDHSDEWTNRIMNDRVTLPLFIGDRIALGLGATLSHVGYARESPFYFEGLLYGFDLGSAVTVLPGLSIGVRTHFVYGWTEKNTTVAANGAVGIMYMPYPEVSYGLSYGGIGTGPVFYHVGNETILDKIPLTRKLQLGASMRFPSPPRSTVLALTLANEKIFGMSGMSYMGGFEFFPLTFAGFRVGYVLHPEFSAAVYGIGIRLDPIRIDYAIVPSRLTNRLHQVTISHDFGFLSYR